MGGGKNDGSKEAAAARADEKKRQAEIRAGTKRINSIFDGGMMVAGNPIGAGTSYDPKATYYNPDGTVWKPGGALGSALSGSLGGLGDLLGGLGGSSGLAAKEWAKKVAEGKIFGSATPDGKGFNDAYYAKRRQAFLDYANPQLEDQYGDAQKELTFALTRSGLLDSSVRGEKVSELQKAYDLNKQQIADEAVASEGQARNAVEDARANLIAMLNATGDATGAANAALARSAALSKPAAYSPMSQLFGDFTATLGTQAALERANAYSGGSVGGRYSTGLFAPSSKSVAVGR